MDAVELNARAREATLAMITAAMTAILDGDVGPMNEVTAELGRELSPEEMVPFLSAMQRHSAEAMGRFVKVIGDHTGMDPRELWQSAALDMAKSPGL